MDNILIEQLQSTVENIQRRPLCNAHTFQVDKSVIGK